MFTTNWSKNLLTYSMLLVGFILLGSLVRTSATLAQDNPAYLREVRIFDPDFVMPNVAGLAFSPDADIFLVLEVHRTDQPAVGDSNFMMITPFEDLVGLVSVEAATAEPINIAFDSKANRLLLFDTAANELVAIKAAPTGYLDPTAITRFEAQQFGLQNPQGMTLDPANGRLFILDSATSRIVRIEPGPDQSFDGAAALSDGRISQVDLGQIGQTDLRSLAFNPTNGHLYLLSPAAQTMVELTETGQVVATCDLTPLGLRDPQGMVFAPSGDLTDDPSQMNLYLADSGLGPILSPGPGKYQLFLPIIIKQSQEAGALNEDSQPGQEGPGRIFELSLTPPLQTASSVSAMQSSLVNTINTNQFSPPSPDPMGLAYHSSSNKLLISDSEVEEMPPYWAGVNLFETTLPGSLMDTFSTTSFSTEPTGVAFNPANGHLFFSDDNKKKYSKWIWGLMDSSVPQMTALYLLVPVVLGVMTRKELLTGRGTSL